MGKGGVLSAEVGAMPPEEPRPSEEEVAGAAGAAGAAEGAAVAVPSHAYSRANYAAEVENLDRLFGEVIAAARARGHSEAEDLLVCALSDHGEMLGDHGLIGKQVPWQGSLNVPLLCAGPGIRRNATLDVPVATLDVGATLLDFASATMRARDDEGGGGEGEGGGDEGGAAAGAISARSFRGLLEGADPATRNRTTVLSGLQSVPFGTPLDPSDPGSFSWRVAVAEHAGPPRSTYKLVCCKGRCPGTPSAAAHVRPDADGYTRLLYDIIADPFELNDSMGQSGRLGGAMAAHQRLLWLRLKAWGCPPHS